MKNYQKIFVLMIAGILIIPQVTLAAWWNPFSWSIFSFSPRLDSHVQMTSTTTSPNQDTIDLSTTTVTATNLQDFKVFSATLSVPAAMRKCSSSQCEVIRYYADTAIVRVIGQDDSGNWYHIEAKGDSGNLLQGWMTKSAFIKTTVSKDSSTQKNNRTQTVNNNEGVSEQVKPINIALSVKFDDSVIKSVLLIKIYDTVLKQDVLWGSGISIGGLGNILTNYHVVEKAIVDPNRYQVYGCVTTSLSAQCDYFNYLLSVTKKLPSNGINTPKFNKNLDLALVYIDQVYFDNKWSSVLGIPLNALGDHTINLSSYINNYTDLPINDPVYSVGYPDYGGGKTVQAEGVVKELWKDPQSGQLLVLNSIDISHGNSGGPVFNSNGELVGVTVKCLTASSDTEKCNTYSGLFIPLPTVNSWYTQITNSEIITWEGKQSYLQNTSVSWQGALCSLRQNSYYDTSVSKDSCICKAGYSKNSSGDCVDSTGYVDPTLNYGMPRDPEGEQRALKALMDTLNSLGASSKGIPPSSDRNVNDLYCVGLLGPNHEWDGNTNIISCACKKDTLYFPNVFVKNPKWSGIVHKTYQANDVAGWSGACVDPKTITAPYKCSGMFCGY